MTTALDPKTLTRVAKVICDIDGPSERRGYELEQLLRDAGWSNPPEYDGSGRVRWLDEALADRARIMVTSRVCYAGSATPRI